MSIFNLDKIKNLFKPPQKELDIIQRVKTQLELDINSGVTVCPSDSSLAIVGLSLFERKVYRAAFEDVKKLLNAECGTCGCKI